MRLAGVVLAGGKSRRMGADKATLPFGEATLLERVVHRVKACCHPVFVVLSRPGSYPHLGLSVLVDRWPGLGPLAGLDVGLRACPEEYAAVVACDLPFVKPRFLRGLARQAKGADAAVPVTDRPHPLCAVYRRRVADVAELLLRAGGGSLRDLLARVQVHYVPEEVLRRWDPHLESLVNVNTPEDYAQALARLQAEGGTQNSAPPSRWVQ